MTNSERRKKKIANIAEQICALQMSVILTLSKCPNTQINVVLNVIEISIQAQNYCYQ